jgi:hypothetical protein
MNARDDCYEPDDEDLAYELYKERQLEGYRIDYAYIDRELRDYRKHTERQLRELSKERKSFARDCKLEHEFNLAPRLYVHDRKWGSLHGWTRHSAEIGQSQLESRRKLKLKLVKTMDYDTRKACTPTYMTSPSRRLWRNRTGFSGLTPRPIPCLFCDR